MKRHILAMGLVLGVSLLFQRWFLGPTPQGKEIDDVYLSSVYLSTAYTEALAHGQSHLLVEPDPRLVTASDPFSSEFRQYLVSDTSLYHGHYYMYFGIVPFVTVLVPWFKLTGTILSPGAAILLFCTMGYLGYGGILLMVSRRWPQRLSPIVLAAAFVGLIAGSGTWPLMSRPAIYEIENAAAFACLSLALFFLFWAEMHREKPRTGLMGAAGFAALSLGCRPNYFPAVTVIACWVLYRSFTSTHGALQRVTRSLANLTPLLLIGLALAWWNYHRFDSPLDFGLKHTVSEDPRFMRPLATLTNIPYNAHRYVLGSARLIRYFPYIQGQQPGPLRLGPSQEPSNQVYGFLLISPLLLCAGLLSFRAKLQIFDVCRPFLAVAFLAFLGNFAFLCCIPMNCYRYPADFLGPLTLLAALGVLSVSEIESKWIRRLIGLLVVLLLVWSGCALVFQLFSTAQTTFLFDLRRTADFATASRPFNHLEYFIEQLRHDGPRALGVTIRLPRDRLGQVEPLVVTGENGAQDFLYLNYVHAGAIQLGFESTGHGGLRSGYIKIDYDQPHRFELRYGSFLPPDDHPLVRQMAPGDLALARKMITVLVDDEIVLDGWAEFHPPRANFFIGQSPDDPAFGSKFGGEILGIDWPRLPAKASPRRWDKDAYGPLVMNMEFRPMPPGVFDPLLSLGEAGQGAQVLIEHLAEPQVRLVWLDTKGKRISSPAFAWPAGEGRKVVIMVGALLPPVDSSLWPATVPAAARISRKQALSIVVGETEILNAMCTSPDVSPTTVAVGRDQLFLSSGVMPSFTGPLGPVGRSPW